MTELRKCPFCGGEAQALKEHPRLHKPGRGGWHIQCNYCNLLFGYDTDYAGDYATQEEAITDWNTRSPDIEQVREKINIERTRLHETHGNADLIATATVLTLEWVLSLLETEESK